MTWRVQAAIAADLWEEFSRAERDPGSSRMSYWIYNLVFYESFGGGNACEAEIIHNFARRMGIVFNQEASRQIDLLLEQASTCHWWFPFEEVVLASERPMANHLDDQGGLHNLTGPALTYADGWVLWALRGIVVSKEVVQKFDQLTAGEIANEKNAELRRVLIEVLGLPRFLRESGARKMHDDKWGTLWRMEFAGEEPMVMVELPDSTPRPDGQARTYFLRVPPTVKTPHEAVAWSFHKSPDDYDPEQQT